MTKDINKQITDNTLRTTQSDSDAQIALKIASDLTDKPEIVHEDLLRTQEVKMETKELSHWYGDHSVL